jgi:hypothetical protein
LEQLGGCKPGLRLERSRGALWSALVNVNDNAVKKKNKEVKSRQKNNKREKEMTSHGVPGRAKGKPTVLETSEV